MADSVNEWKQGLQAQPAVEETTHEVLGRAEEKIKKEIW